MPTNDFLPFCPTDTGTNILSQSDYIAAADRTSGNKTGIASSKLNNKAIRQSNAITSQLAQLISNQTGTDVLDDANSAKLLAQLTAAISPLPPLFDQILSGTGTYNKKYVFFLGSGSATIGATYTHNSFTYTVIATVTSASQIILSGNGDPLTSGTLSKSSGTGDSTITFFAVRAPINYRVTMVGGGGGGSGSGASSPSSPGGNGGTSFFGSSLLTTTGGDGGAWAGGGGFGGSATVNSPALPLIAVNGGGGGGAIGVAAASAQPGMAGAASALGGGGNTANSGSTVATQGGDGQTNTGGGGGAAGGPASSYCGSAGGSGAYLEAIIPNPAPTYTYQVGTGGTQGPAGGSGALGGNGGSGLIVVEVHF